MGWTLSLLVVLLLVGAPCAAQAQLFFASRPDPPFTIGPLMIRANVTEAPGAVSVHVLWSVVPGPNRRSADVAQDLYLLWPGEVSPAPGLGKPDPALAQYVESLGMSAIGEGRLGLFAQSLQDAEGGTVAVVGGAPFVTFVQTSGTLGLSPPATWIRIPWNPRMSETGWLMDLRLDMAGLMKPKKSTWLETIFMGERHQITLSFNEVRDRPLFPVYFAHRARLVRLADAPSELVVNFAHADRLKIDQVFPPTHIRRVSETLESTEVVSLFLGTGDGVAPQHLSVHFGYFSRVQGVVLVAIPLLLLALGPALGPVIGRLVMWLGGVLATRLHWGAWSGAPRGREGGVILTREVLGKIVPGETTREDVLRLCGTDVEEHEQWGAGDRRTLMYRGHRVVPEARRILGWLSTVRHWEVERHEVRVEMERDVVRDVQAQVRRYRASAGEGA